MDASRSFQTASIRRHFQIGHNIPALEKRFIACRRGLDFRDCGHAWGRFGVQGQEGCLGSLWDEFRCSRLRLTLRSLWSYSGACGSHIWVNLVPCPNPSMIIWDQFCEYTCPVNFGFAKKSPNGAYPRLHKSSSRRSAGPRPGRHNSRMFLLTVGDPRYLARPRSDRPHNMLFLESWETN